MKAIVGGVIAFILLGLYGASVIVAIILVARHGPLEGGAIEAARPATRNMDGFTDGLSLSMTTIGALVSSLVISVLAATDPGTKPLERGIKQGEPLSPRWEWVAQVAVFAYLGTWMVCGLAAFIFGEIIYPGVLPTLTDHGRAWIGLAVSSAYAYFGLKAPGGRGGDDPAA